MNYLKRPGALEVDPVALSIADKAAVTAKRLLPVAGLPFFGGIRDAAPDAWGRRVIEAKLKVPANSLPESQYLLHAGSDRVGALDIRNHISDAPTVGASAWHSLAHLVEAASRIDEGLPVPAHLDAIFQGGSALGGARPKASIRDEQGILWLAKFASASDAMDVPTIEAATLLLAKETGQCVPPVRTQSLCDRSVMLIQRFDRYWSEVGTECRMGFVSGLTMLGCDESESPNKSYADLADAIRRYCHPSVIRRDNEELFRRMVFNILVTNDDDHLRNHGFVWDPRLSGWALSPLYDVMPRAAVATERYLHLGVGPQGRLADLDNALAAHAKFTLSQSKACEIMSNVWAVVREWRVYFDQYGVAEEQMDKVATAFRHIDHVSSAKLRKLLL
ncbi:type II toxin-antitoxin system HipA family toxin [Limnohabitans sp. TS-CS-82]|uniref:type II toxin-antitoxin system HipA family toxin n=1 Tax=Limnohabitans sp. TS-CS-82 TaxID=2094193 RepID=UPI001F464D74|nr:HipA domain-containing protein [Limnohabitans sp. TS-CS-82]